MSSPWWPDLWQMTSLLENEKLPLLVAAGCKTPPMEASVPAAAAPHRHAMFDMLCRPQLALGQGLILKRALPSCMAILMGGRQLLQRGRVCVGVRVPKS